METMYWYNPTSRTMEDANVPMNDEQAIDMLSHDEDSDGIIEYYRGWRDRHGIMEALIRTGEHYRDVHAGRAPSL
ncbi:MAG: hypothetical protein H0U02_02630 [Rubrobacter sp.]|jgi:hypothetical protein|nr:hypothetical protein [Rubrobacter sp.]MBA3702666.1 hypothetical protein [Rubrobacteraceae bacterium]